MGWQVTLTDKALEDLEAVVAFLAMVSPPVAERIGLEIVDLIFSLDQLPHRGARVKARNGLRKLSYRFCLIYYQTDDVAKTVTIVRIWDGRRNPARLDV